MGQALAHQEQEELFPLDPAALPDHKATLSRPGWALASLDISELSLAGKTKLKQSISNSHDSLATCKSGWGRFYVRVAVSLLAPQRTTECASYMDGEHAICRVTSSPQGTLSTWLCWELAGTQQSVLQKSQGGFFINPWKEEASFQRKGYRENAAAWHIMFPCLHLPGGLGSK